MTPIQNLIRAFVLSAVGLMPMLACAIHGAQALFWLGPALEPFLLKPAAANTKLLSIKLLDIEHVQRLPQCYSSILKHQDNAEDDHIHLHDIDPHI